jgi:hypothetical protein
MQPQYLDNLLKIINNEAYIFSNNEVLISDSSLTDFNDMLFMILELSNE